MEVPQFFPGWRGHPVPRLRRRPRRGATRSRPPTRRTRPRWRRTSMPRREIVRREARERLFFVSSSESRTTIQVNCELDFKSTANLTSSQVATSLQVKLGLHFNRHSDFTSSEREQPLWGYFWDAWRGTCLEVVIGGSVHGDRPCGRAERRGAGRLGFSCRDSRHRTETSQRSRRRIFTYGEMEISTSPFICRGVAIFMP